MPRPALERLVEFASELGKKRKDARYAAALADVIGCSQPTAWRVLSGERAPSLKIAVAIERATKTWRGGQIRAGEWIPEAKAS
jgi:hypothetical protein